MLTSFPKQDFLHFENSFQACCEKKNIPSRSLGRNRRQAVISRRLRRSLPPAAASRRQGHFVQLEPRFAAPGQQIRKAARLLAARPLVSVGGVWHRRRRRRASRLKLCQAWRLPNPQRRRAGYRLSARCAGLHTLRCPPPAVAVITTAAVALISTHRRRRPCPPTGCPPSHCALAWPSSPFGDLQTYAPIEHRSRLGHQVCFPTSAKHRFRPAG